MLQDKWRAGQFDREITFLQIPISVGNANSDYKGPMELISDPTQNAYVQEMRGTEVVVNDRLTYVQKTLFVIRYRSDITVLNKIRYNSRLYDIISLNETQSRRRFLEIVANLRDTETT